jgi:hypothetical protein
MEKLLDKYNGLEIAVKIRIRAKIISKGNISKFRTEKVLKIKDGQQFNLDGGRYLTEISSTELIDNNGYSYDYSVLPIEKLCEAVDNA